MEYLWNILFFFTNILIKPFATRPDNYQRLEQGDPTRPQSSTHVSSQTRRNTPNVKRYGRGAGETKVTRQDQDGNPSTDEGRPGNALELEKRKEEMRMQLLKLKHEKKYLRGNIARQKHELEDLRRQQAARTHKSELLVTRQRELQLANRSIITQDTYSLTHIRDCIDKLNQKLVAISSSATSSELSRTAKGNEETITQILGDGLAQLFFISCQKESALLLKAVLQIFLCQHICVILQSWSTLELNQFLDDYLYNHIVRTEEQAISGKWREMTYKGLQIDSSKWLRDYAQLVSDAFIQILLLSGWKDIRKEEDEISDNVQKLCHDSYEIGKQMKTEVISYDLQPIGPHFGERFDKIMMVDSSKKFGMRVEVNDQLHVLGTTEIGLRAYVKGRSTSLEGSMSPRVVLWEGATSMLDTSSR